MSRACPICNFQPQSLTQDGSVLSFDCRECGKFSIEEDCAKNFRVKFLSFDISSVGGRDLFKHNMNVIKMYIAHHQKSPMTDDLVSKLPGMYLPYPSQSKVG